MSPLSSDPEKRARQLANLRSAPPAPAGNQRRLVHGGRSELLLRDIEQEVAELLGALADAAPVKDADGGAPAADYVALERAARALKRYRSLASWLDLHGRITEKGDVKPAAELELRAERELAAALDALGMTPTSRARLGVDLSRIASSEVDRVEHEAAARRLRDRFAAFDRGDVIDAGEAEGAGD